jgi:hypothetical protein
MPDATITSTASTFGTISGVFSADQSTISGTISGIVPGTLSGSVGVPGPAGSPGAPGVGVPAGGTAGQYLQKIDGVDYNTDWVTLNLSGFALLSGANFTGRVTVPSIAGDFAGFNIGTTSADPDSKENGDLWVYDDAGITPSTLKVFLDSETRNIATESWVTTVFAPKASPVFTGDPRAPTPATSDNDTSIATTAFVKAQGYAPLASPAFTGNPTAPTAALGDNDTSIATTAFVQQELLSGTANARNLEVYVRNQTGSTIPAGAIVYINGATGNRPTITLAQANNDANSAQTFGFVKTAIANNGFGFVIVRGELENVDTSALTEGVQLYLSPTTAGAYTTTKPAAPQHLVYVGICVRAHPTQGVILVAIQNGYELGEIHDIQLGTLANNDLLAYESSTDLWKNKTFSALGLLTSADAASTYLTSATAASTYQTISGMSSYLTTASAASTYFTIASAANKADLASPAFTGTPSLPTGTIAVTQTAGNNTTAVATTAFVTTADNLKANIASPSLTGTPLSVTSSLSNRSTQIATMEAVKNMIWHPGSKPFYSIYEMQSIVSGTGATVTAFPPYSWRLRGASNVAGSALVRTNNSSVNSNNNAGLSRGANNGDINWSNPVWFSFRMFMDTVVSTEVFRATIGKATGAAVGDLSNRGIGIRITGQGFVVLQVHNGTTLTNVTSSFQTVLYDNFDVEVFSDGTGNVTLFINGSSVATTTAGPTTKVSTGGMVQLEVVTAGGAGGQSTTYVHTLKSFFGE